MTIYWSSSKAPVHLFRREYESREVAKYISDNSFIDAAMLSADLGLPGLNTWAVEAYQRRLGVRKIVSRKGRA